MVVGWIYGYLPVEEVCDAVGNAGGQSDGWQWYNNCLFCAHSRIDLWCLCLCLSTHNIIL